MSEIGFNFDLDAGIQYYDVISPYFISSATNYFEVDTVLVDPLAYSITIKADIYSDYLSEYTTKYTTLEL